SRRGCGAAARAVHGGATAGAPSRQPGRPPGFARRCSRHGPAQSGRAVPSFGRGAKTGSARRGVAWAGVPLLSAVPLKASDCRPSGAGRGSPSPLPGKSGRHCDSATRSEKTLGGKQAGHDGEAPDGKTLTVATSVGAISWDVGSPADLENL